jgi:UDP-2,3-diacylglucosamine pyrophosphatase LpxH
VLPAGWQLAGATLLAIPLSAWLHMAMTSREPSDPRSAMVTSASAIRRIARVPIVVMGHSHDPCAQQDPEGWYFNTGTWVPHQDPRKAFTHVRIERTDSGVRAVLCQWRDGASRIWQPRAS